MVWLTVQGLDGSRSERSVTVRSGEKGYGWMDESGHRNECLCLLGLLTRNYLLQRRSSESDGQDDASYGCQPSSEGHLNMNRVNEPSVCGGRDGSSAGAQNHRFPPTKTSLATAPAEYSTPRCGDQC